MALTGFLEFENEDATGESLESEYSNHIQVHGVHWQVSQKSSAAIGSGLAQGRAEVGSMSFYKWYDSASPNLALACMSGRMLSPLTFRALKDAGEIHLEYITIKMSQGFITGYEMENDGKDPDIQMIREKVSISFQMIDILYVKQAPDGSSDGDFNIEYDISARA